MGLLDYVYAVLLILGLPVYAQVFYQWLEQRLGRQLPGARIGVYRAGTLVQWLLAGIVLARWWATGRPWAELGLGAPAAASAGYALLILFLAAAGAVWIWNLVTTDATARLQVLQQLGDLDALLPRTPRERNWAWVVSLTAGACEELLFRGFLFWWMRPLAGDYGAMALAALSFGSCHAYQGWRGVVKTTVAGLLFGALVLFTDALWLAIALHAFIDLNSLSLAHAILSLEDARARAAARAERGPLAEAGELEDEGWGTGAND